MSRSIRTLPWLSCVQSRPECGQDVTDACSGAQYELHRYSRSLFEDPAMHFCFLEPPIEFYSPISGGALATITFQMARELQGMGHTVTVMAPGNGDPVYDVGRLVSIYAPQRADLTLLQRAVSRFLHAVTGWDWPYYEYYLISTLWQLKRLPSRPDVVVVFNDLQLPSYVKKVLPTARVVVDLQNEQRTRANNVKAALAAIDGFVCCSAYIREWTRHEYSLADRLHVLHSGVDLTAFTPAADCFVASGTLRILFIGRIDPNKGPHLALQAYGRLRQETGHASMTIAGGVWFYNQERDKDDPFFRSVMGLVTQFGATYAGHVIRRDVPALVRSHDVVLVLSRSSEPFGLVVLEAMASGCAVIASNRGGLPEACDGAAELVDPDDADAVLGKLRAFCDPARLEAAKRASLNRAQRASWKSVTTEFLRIVERIIHDE